MSFPNTRLSVVARTRSGDEETRRVAYAAIIEAYWKPAYKHLRMKWSLDPEAAADLTQEFFTTTLEGRGRRRAARLPRHHRRTLSLGNRAARINRRPDRRLRDDEIPAKDSRCLGCLGCLGCLRCLRFGANTPKGGRPACPTTIGRWRAPARRRTRRGRSCAATGRRPLATRGS